MRWDMMTKRKVAMVVIGAIGFANTPVLEDLVVGIYNYDIYAGFTVRSVLGILSLAAAYMLWKRHF